MRAIVFTEILDDSVTAKKIYRDITATDTNTLGPIYQVAAESGLFTSVDINGGNIDGTSIGTTTPAQIYGTAVRGTSSVSADSGGVARAILMTNTGGAGRFYLNDAAGTGLRFDSDVGGFYAPTNAAATILFHESSLVHAGSFFEVAKVASFLGIVHLDGDAALTSTVRTYSSVGGILDEFYKMYTDGPTANNWAPWRQLTQLSITSAASLVAMNTPVQAAIDNTKWNYVDSMQDVNASASPTFAAMTIVGALGAGTCSVTGLLEAGSCDVAGALSAGSLTMGGSIDMADNDILNVVTIGIHAGGAIAKTDAGELGILGYTGGTSNQGAILIRGGSPASGWGSDVNIEGGQGQTSTGGRIFLKPGGVAVSGGGGNVVIQGASGAYADGTHKVTFGGDGNNSPFIERTGADFRISIGSIGTPSGTIHIDMSNGTGTLFIEPGDGGVDMKMRDSVSLFKIRDQSEDMFAIGNRADTTNGSFFLNRAYIPTSEPTNNNRVYRRSGTSLVAGDQVLCVSD